MLAGGRRLFVSPDAALQFYGCGGALPGGDLFNFAREYVTPGAVVWDIGASCGLFTFAAAHAAGPNGEVLAVEPDLFCANLLARSRSACAGGAKVSIVALAVGEEIGRADFHVARRGRSTSHLASCAGSSQTGGVRETVSVGVVTLDWLMSLTRAPSVLKIDVETAEALVLRGGRELLRRHHPTILCEVSDACAPEVTRELRSHGYRLFDWMTRPIREVAEATWATLARRD